MDMITELYYGSLSPVEQMGKLTPEAKAILKRIHDNEEKLEAMLNKQERELLHTIQDDHLDVSAIISEKRFEEAFTLGARLMIEILTQAPQ